MVVEPWSAQALSPGTEHCVPCMAEALGAGWAGHPSPAREGWARGFTPAYTGLCQQPDGILPVCTHHGAGAGDLPAFHHHSIPLPLHTALPVGTHGTQGFGHGCCGSKVPDPWAHSSLCLLGQQIAPPAHSTPPLSGAGGVWGADLTVAQLQQQSSACSSEWAHVYLQQRLNGDSQLPWEQLCPKTKPG